MAIEIEGVAHDAVPGFLAGLAQASERLGAIPARLEAARVHDAAFGKLFDAAKVRDAYHQRLPATEENITEARQLINHFLGEFGGTPLELPPEAVAAAAAGATAGSESQAAATEQNGSAQAAAEPVAAANPVGEPEPQVVATEQDGSAQAAAVDVTAAQAVASGEPQAEAEPGPVAEVPEVGPAGSQDCATSAVTATSDAIAPEVTPAQTGAAEPAVEPEPDPEAPAETSAAAESAESSAPAGSLAELIPGQAQPPTAESIPDES